MCVLAHLLAQIDLIAKMQGLHVTCHRGLQLVVILKGLVNQFEDRHIDLVL